ncbi:patatin-like phospholipase family protein [Phenylobacterium terrae]|uniref:Patatin-like phospholipase family protein n=1 Tax=Phenylobacterium terrae TaxID=2665495 RepID=A0ABW4N207_9CAUL
MRRTVRLGLAILAAGAQLHVTACATPKRLAAVPSALTVRAELPVANARYFPDRDPHPYEQEFLASFEREKAWRASTAQSGPLPPIAALSISGGGGDGAFGAGLLFGWSEAGTRPEFKMVTGVSTGALIAPFAFLGPRYDHVLKQAYTETSDADIFKRRHFTAALFSDAMADTAPMARLIDSFVTRELLDEIAAEYAKGRLLFVGTTNLDAREAIYWNMGAIAASKDPRALELFRKVTLASAAIPGAFPPVMIDVTIDGVPHQEMHVDGGATRQVFMYPQRVHLGEMTRRFGAERARSVYIIRNSRLDADWASVDRRTLSIVNRSVSALIQNQGFGDLDRIYLTSIRDGLDYNLAYIPSDFSVPKTSDFDSAYMRPLFERGRQLARAGYPWEKVPPGYGRDVAAPPVAERLQAR